MNTVVSRFVLGKRVYYFKTTWEDRRFEIEVSDGKSVWQGFANEPEIIERLKPQGMDLEEYMGLVRSALTQQDIQENKFSYSIDDSSHPTNIELCWKIKLEDGSIVFFVKGILSLSKVGVSNQASLRQFMDLLIDKKAVLEKDNKDLTTKNLELQQQRNAALIQLEKLIAEKQTLERGLYHKFLQVLNEKKKKIKELKQQEREIITVVKKEADAKSDNSQSDEEKSKSPTQVTDFLSLSQGTSLNPSLNFYTTDPTPHDSNWLSLEESYHIKPSVRKRKRRLETKGNSKTKTPSPSTPKDLKNSKQAQPISSSLKVSDEHHSPPKKTPLKTNAEFQSSLLRSPGILTPSPTSRTPRKRKSNSQLSDNLGAEDLLDML